VDIGTTPVTVHFRLYDPWESDIGLRLLDDLGVERPTQWSPLNWVDDYPFILVDGVVYYYP